MNIKLKGTPGIFLVGFMGSGKSTVGRLLAQRLGWDAKANRRFAIWSTRR